MVDLVRGATTASRERDGTASQETGRRTKTRRGNVADLVSAAPKTPRGQGADLERRSAVQKGSVTDRLVTLKINQYECSLI